MSREKVNESDKQNYRKKKTSVVLESQPCLVNN